MSETVKTVVIACTVCHSQVEITERQYDEDDIPRCPRCGASECGYA